MDPKRLKEAYTRLDVLDDRLSYRLRPSSSMMSSPTNDQLDKKIKELAEFTLELKDIMREFMLAFAKQPQQRPPG